MPPEELLGAVVIAVVDDAAIIAGEDYQRIIRDPEAIQGAQHLPYRPVELYDGIPAQPHTALPAEAGVGEARYVHVVGGEVDEEGLRALALLTDEVDGVPRDGVGDVLIPPQRLAPALHIADAADAVDDGHIVPVAGAELIEELGMGTPCGLAREVLTIVHLNGRRGVVVRYAPVVHEDAGHTVGGGRHDVGLVEAQIHEPWRDEAIPVLRPCLVPQPQMPLAEGRRTVARGLEEVGHRVLLGADDHARIAWGDIRARSSPSVLPRQHAVAGGCAGGGCGVGVGQA